MSLPPTMRSNYGVWAKAQNAACHDIVLLFNTRCIINWDLPFLLELNLHAPAPMQPCNHDTPLFWRPRSRTTSILILVSTPITSESLFGGTYNSGPEYAYPTLTTWHSSCNTTFFWRLRATGPEVGLTSKLRIFVLGYAPLLLTWICMAHPRTLHSCCSTVLYCRSQSRNLKFWY